MKNIFQEDIPLIHLFKQVIAVLVILLCAVPAYAKDQVIALKVVGAINPIVADYLSREIQNANETQETLVVIEMDTPGGLDTSMRVIIKEIQNSTIPVATYVSPSGSRAASAGTFITIASHIAAMAPGTNIGAAHPVNMMGSGEGQESTMNEKVTSDAAAYIRSLAELRGRNVYWAELSVKKSVSISAEEAKKLGVIDLIAGNLDALLLAVDGREVNMGSQKVTLHTKDKKVVFREMNRRQSILAAISDPNVAYILLMMGLVGLYFELSNPGLILPGVVGGISIILAMYAMHTLPINYAGLLLILLGIIMFIAEIKIMSYGLLSVGGTVSILLGSLMLVNSEDPTMQISHKVLYPTAAISILISAATIFLAAKSHRLRAISGVDGLVGEKGVAKTDLSPLGRVFVHGEMWNAEGEGTVKMDDKVVVKAVDGLTIKVKKLEKE